MVLLFGDPVGDNEVAGLSMGVSAAVTTIFLNDGLGGWSIFQINVLFSSALGL